MVLRLNIFLNLWSLWKCLSTRERNLCPMLAPKMEMFSRNSNRSVEEKDHSLLKKNCSWYFQDSAVDFWKETWQIDISFLYHKLVTFG